MLFIDIETCSAAKDLKGFIDIIGPNGEEHWSRKAKYVRKDSEEYSEKSDSRVFHLTMLELPVKTISSLFGLRDWLLLRSCSTCVSKRVGSCAFIWRTLAITAMKVSVFVISKMSDMSF